MNARKSSCTGCLQRIHPKDKVVACRFRTKGFTLPSGVSCRPCVVQYHTGCVQVGEPFRTRLRDRKGLYLPTLPDFPGFICELCTVRAILGREIRYNVHDSALLAFERMRLLDVMNSWSTGTHEQYQSKMRVVREFERAYGVCIFPLTPVPHPPITPAIPLGWCQQQYSLRRSSRAHSGDPKSKVSYGSTRAIRSAANLFFKLDLQTAYPGAVLLDRAQRTIAVRDTIPTDEMCCTLMHSGMATRLGEDSNPSEVLLDVHVRYLDQSLHRLYEQASDPQAKLEIARAGFSNLNLWCAWLRGEEHFQLRHCDIEVVRPSDGPKHQLPQGVGCLLERLKPDTKKSRTKTADMVISYTTGSGLSPGLWYDRILYHDNVDLSNVANDTRFVCRHSNGTRWDSRHLRSTYLWPHLIQQRLEGEPTLQRFDGSPGQSIAERFYSSNSWRRGGETHVSKKRPGCKRKATTREVEEHGRWRQPRSSLPMPVAYRQWSTNDRVAITLCCQ